METINFAERLSVEFVEEGNILAPKFNKEGILPVVVTETKSGMVLMIGYMNKDALDQTILTKQGHYWSRSRRLYYRRDCCLDRRKASNG